MKIGVLPDQNLDSLSEIYEPLISYLENKLNIPCELVIPESYSHMVDLFQAHKIDLAYFGGVTFVMAKQRCNAVPLVIRDVDRRFTSYFIVSSKSKAKSILNLNDATMAFGAKLSTSGHYMPRFFLQEIGIEPESFFGSVSYTGSHDKTATKVGNGEFELGAVNSRIVEKMLEKGRLNNIRVLWETPEYVDYVWALHPHCGKEFEMHIRDAFLDLTMEDPEHINILGNLHADYFLPAKASDFKLLEKIMNEVSF